MTTPTDSFSPESWEYARGYAGVFGSIPSSFTSVIRSLMSEHTAGLANTQGNSKYFVLRLLKSPSLLAPLYFGAKAFSPEVIVENGYTSPDAIAKSFSPSELAALLGTVFLVRKAQGLVSEEEFKYIIPPAIPATSVAMAIGRTIPAIGGGTALFDAMIVPLAVCAFAKHDPKNFKEYRREVIKNRGGVWNCADEVANWGCNHLQIGSVLLQTLGFGIPRANAFVNAVASKGELGTDEENRLCRDFRMARLWRTAILTTGAAPTVPLPPKYYPTNAAQQQAIDQILVIQGDKELSNWVVKGKEDLSPAQLAGPVKTGSSNAAQSETQSQEDAALDELTREIEELSS